MLASISAIALLASGQAIPQTTTVATEAMSLTSDGKPSRCEIDFVAINRDDVDGEGKMVGVRGTYGLDLVPGHPSTPESASTTFPEIRPSNIVLEALPWRNSGGDRDAAPRAPSDVHWNDRSSSVNQPKPVSSCTPGFLAFDMHPRYAPIKPPSSPRRQAVSSIFACEVLAEVLLRRKIPRSRKPSLGRDR